MKTSNSQFHEDYMKPINVKQKGMFDVLKNECRNFCVATNIYSRKELKNANILRAVEKAEKAVDDLNTLLIKLRNT